MAMKWSGLGLWIVVLSAPGSALAGEAVQPKILHAGEMAQLVAHAKGDTLVHLTLTVPSCPPCIRSLANLPALVGRSDWKGRFIQVQWNDWNAMGNDQAALKLKDGFVYVPLVVWYRDGVEKARYTLDQFPKLERELKAQ
jgi:hypothetical protein